LAPRLGSRFVGEFLVRSGRLEPYEIRSAEEQLVYGDARSSTAGELEKVSERNYVAGFDAGNIARIEETDFVGIIFHKEPGQLFIVHQADAPVNLRQPDAHGLFHPGFRDLFVDAGVLNLHSVLQRIADAILQVERYGVFLLRTELKD